MSSLIDLNNIKEVCRHCEGTGIIKHYNDKVGTICSYCRGKGYLIFEKDYIVKISKKQNLLSNDKYLIKSKWNMLRSLYLFRELAKRNDIDFVAFANDGLLGTTKQWYSQNDIPGEIITYKDYLNGLFPLPDEKVLCPKNFNDYPFDINTNCSLICTEEQRNNCWQDFYKDANSIEQKQKAISAKVKSLTPRKTHF